MDDRFLAQTSEITILLEKKIPQPAEPESAPGEPRTSEESPAAAERPVGDEVSEPLEETAARPLTSTQKTETYEPLEDPFAVEEEVTPLADPFEGYNRFMFQVNERIWEYFMEPLARGWRFVMPEDVRVALKNMFDNATAPVKLVSSLLQGDLDKSGRVIGRTVINTTIGVGGAFDVAGDQFEIKNVNEDMDQALGAHMFPTGPYIVLPFLGPSTARGVVGRTVDSFLSPSVILAPSFFVGAGITLGENMNDSSFIIEDKEQLEESAIDEYESVRDFFHQYRQGLVKE